ncbi:MAG: FkbM family methyltransferase [Patescibacteria group bacterium]
MTLFIKNFFKKHFFYLYKAIRSVLFPIYKLYQKLSLKKFTETVLFDFNYADIGFKIFLNPKNGFIDKEIFWKGVYEEDFLDFLKQEIHSEDVYIDIGANIGQHALFVSRIVKRGLVYAFEPNPAIYDQFTKSIEANGIKNIQQYNIGLGAEKSEQKLFLNTENIGGSSQLQYKDAMSEITMHIEKGDDILGPICSKVDFIKIDVEGFEYEALVGLTETIKKYKPKMLIEFTPVFYNKKNSQDAQHILDFLLAHGYSFRDLEAAHSSTVYKTKEEMTAWLTSMTKDQTNIFCFNAI